MTGEIQRPMSQRVIYIQSPQFLSPAQVEQGPGWAELFGNDNPLALEIGCGTGHFVIQRARQQPDVNFIAIDIYNKGCWKTCKKIDALGLTNIRVARTEASSLLNHSFDFGQLQAIYINCPDPWPKKRHRKRRLVNRAFLSTALLRLAPGGDFFFSSDFADYAQDVAALLDGQFAFRNCQPRLLADHLTNYPLSKYMQRFRDKGQPIYFLHFQRDPAVSEAEIQRRITAPEARSGFRSRGLRATHE